MVRYGKRNVGCRLPERSRQLRDTGYARGRGHEVRGEAEAGRQRGVEESYRKLEGTADSSMFTPTDCLPYTSFPIQLASYVLPIRFRCPVSSFKDAVELLESCALLCRSVRLNLFSD